MNQLINRLALTSILLTAVHFNSLYAQGRRGDADWRVEPAKFGWLFDYEAAKTNAREANKPLMLVFRCVP